MGDSKAAIGSIWSDKLHAKLSTLLDSSSEASHQAIAKWILFHRKRLSDFLPTFLSNMKQRPTSTLAVIHSLFLMDKDRSVSRWEEKSPLRSTMAQQVVLPSVDSSNKEKISPLLDQWETQTVFGEETKKVIGLLRSRLDSSVEPPAPKAEPVSTVSEPSNDDIAGTDDMQGIEINDSPPPSPMKTQNENSKKKDAPIDSASVEGTPSPTKQRSISTPADGAPYDFDATGVPQRNVRPNDFITACKSIATLQIARDLQSDGMAKLASLLQALPPAVQNATAPLDPETVQELVTQVDPQLLELDMEEQIANVRIFRDVVDKQQTARRRLLTLLQASRCQLGSDRVANDYYTMGDADAAKRQQQRLADALELEGLDLETVVKRKAVEPEGPPELRWYTGKRQKIE